MDEGNKIMDQCLISEEEEEKMAVGSVRRLGGRLNEKRGKEKEVQMMEF